MTANPDYEVIVKANDLNFSYKDCEVQEVILKKFQELPQSLTWSLPKLSDDANYFGALGKGSQEDHVFLWERSCPHKYLYTYSKSHINGFEFAPNSRSFVIIYEKTSPIHYNIASGHPIVEFDTKGLDIDKVLTYSFSPKSRYFALATRTGFIVWDALNGKIKQQMTDESPSKYIRKDLLVSISKEGIVKMIKFKESIVLKELTLKNVTSCSQIINCMLSSNMIDFYYVLRDGVYKLDISNGEVAQVQPFNLDNIQLASISFDCSEYLTCTNETVDFWEENHGKTGTIAKEKFNHMSYHFKYHLLITIDDISINITDTANADTAELFVWTNLNPTSFDQYTFSPDYSVLLAVINEHQAALYNSSTGRLIKQWHNKLSNWSDSCQLVGKKSETAILATKSTTQCVKIWNYSNGNEYMSLYGFDCFMTSFSQEGNLLCAGAVEGKEIARAWELNSGDHKSYMNPDHDNKNSHAVITSEAKYLIAQSTYQPPIVFDLDTAQMLCVCQSVIRFRQINEIHASQDNTFFYCHGSLTSDGSPSALIYSFDNPKPIEEVHHCSSIDLSDNAKFLLVKLKKDDDEGTLKQYELSDSMKFIQYKDKSDFSHFLQDNNTVVSSYGDEVKTVFFLYSTSQGKPCGEIDYLKKHKQFSQVEISSKGSSVIIRHIAYEKQN